MNTRLAKLAVTVLYLIIVSCATTAPTTSKSIRIVDLWEPLYKPNYDYSMIANSNDFSGFTIGIIDSDFIEQSEFEKAWKFRSDREKKNLIEFKREVSNALEKILLSKGNKVAGPFSSYEEMTFPERERCSYLIKPVFIIDIENQPESSSVTKLNDVGGPNLENYTYASMQNKVSGTAQMEYVILDPLTQEKLERHKLKTEEISLTYKEYMELVFVNGGRLDFQPLRANPQYTDYLSSYHNSDNASAKILERLFQKFIPQVEQLISVDEFEHLKKYKEQLKEKKVY